MEESVQKRIEKTRQQKHQLEPKDNVFVPSGLTLFAVLFPSVREGRAQPENESPEAAIRLQKPRS